MSSTSPIIDVFNVDEDTYSSLWVKYVRGVDLTQHCIASLIGDRHQGVDRKAKAQVLELTEHPPAPAYYICGVTYPYVWKRNVHLLAVPVEDQEEEHEWRSAGVLFHLYGARPIEIATTSIDPADPHAGDREFFTCRNWQAAWWLHRELGLKNEINPESAYWRRRAKKPSPQQRLALG